MSDKRIHVDSERFYSGDGESHGESLSDVLTRTFHEAGFPLDAYRLTWNAATNDYDLRRVEP